MLKIVRYIIAGILLLAFLFGLLFVISTVQIVKVSMELAKIDYNYEFKDPTYYEMKEFLARDKTDLNEYREGLFGFLFPYVCTNFARDVKRNAIKQGIRCAGVVIWFEDNKLNRAFHVIVAFNTIDKGVIFIEPQTDEEARIVPGTEHFYSNEIVLFYGVFWPKLKDE